MKFVGSTELGTEVKGPFFSYISASLALLLKLLHEGASLPDAELVLNLTVASVWSDGFS